AGSSRGTEHGQCHAQRIESADRRLQNNQPKTVIGRKHEMTRLERLIFVTAVSGALLVTAVGAQAPPPSGTSGPGTVRAVLASTPLASLADAPRYFKLLRVHLPAKHTT